MAKQKENNAGAAVAGAAMVGAAGLAAGILLAPKSGKETRDDISAKAEMLKQKGESMMDSLRNRVESMRGEAEAEGDKIRDEIMAKIDTMKKQIDDFQAKNENSKIAKDLEKRRDDLVSYVDAALEKGQMNASEISKEVQNKIEEIQQKMKD